MKIEILGVHTVLSGTATDEFCILTIWCYLGLRLILSSAIWSCFRDKFFKLIGNLIIALINCFCVICEVFVIKKRKLEVYQPTLLSQLRSPNQVDVTEKLIQPKRVNLSYLSGPYHCIRNNITTKLRRGIKILHIKRW